MSTSKSSSASKKREVKVARRAPAGEAPPPMSPVPPPRALLDFMMTGWQERARRREQPMKGVEEFRARRKALSARFPGDVIVVPTGHEKVRANDTNYRFRPGSNFFYLVGNPEPDCVLLMLPRPKGGHRSLLFVEPEVDRSTPAFYTDRARGALWVGARLGIEGSKLRYGVDEATPLDALQDALLHLRAGNAKVRVVRGLSELVDNSLRASSESTQDAELALALAELRAVKSPAEVTSLVRAIAATKTALEEVIATMRHAKSERELEAVFDARCRIEGAGVGFATIAAAGADATVLHWTRNDQRLPKGKLVLMDCGAEADDLYSADISRTLPLSGKFSPEQRELYDLVIAAQDAAIAAVKPGAYFAEPHHAATRVLVEGLVRLGILRETAEEALRLDRLTYKRYTLHTVSHMLGLDVHDCEPLPYRAARLAPGMVLTIEPGLYFQSDDLTVPARFRGIGIRVEEDVLVTATGRRNLSAQIPRSSRDVERWIAQVWRQRRA